MFKKLLYSVATLAGTMIGVGFFALPYIASKVGFFVILGYFLVLGVLVFLVHLFFAELSIHTPDFKRFPGFAKYYLGEKGEKLAYLTTILGLFGAILSYLIVGGEFLTELLSPVLGGDFIFYTLSYFILGAVVIFYGVKTVAKVEFWGLVLFFAILFLIFFESKTLLVVENLFPTPDMSHIFLPYGVVLFSLWGAALIPEIEEMLREAKRIFKKVIFLSFLITILFYLFFIFLILAITGSQTTPSALAGLSDVLDNGVVVFALCFGLLATFTSFIALGLTLKKVFWYDLKIPKNLSWAMTCFVPLILFFLGFQNFISLISFIGAVFLGIDGILILIMYKKIKPKKAFLIYPLVLIFTIGIAYELFYFLR